MKLPNLALVSLATCLATGSFGCGSHSAFLATAIVGSTILIAEHEHAQREAELAWERERDEAPSYPRIYVINPQPVAYEPPPAPPLPAAPPFDANAARNALAAVDLAGCREAGAPRGYGHAKATVNPSGDISKVVVEEPAGMPPAAVRCVGEAVGRVTVPEFSGSFVTVGTTFFVP
jgi:hypothetical protein